MWLNLDKLKKRYVRNIIPIWNVVCETMRFKNLIMAEASVNISEHVKVINIFHDVRSILYTVTDIYPKAGVLLKVINVIHSVNLPLFIVNNIHSIRKSTANKSP